MASRTTMVRPGGLVGAGGIGGMLETLLRSELLQRGYDSSDFVDACRQYIALNRHAEDRL